jgi:hypothetical protein
MRSVAGQKPSSIIDMERFDEEVLSPEEYLNLTPEERHCIVRARPLVKHLGSTDIDDTSFASLLVKWKNPRYKAKMQW